MTLTDKAKEQFEEFIRVEHPNHYMTSFYQLPPSMQWGVYQDWADSLGCELYIHKDSSEIYFWSTESSLTSTYGEGFCGSLQEARNAAIDKLNELINQ